MIDLSMLKFAQNVRMQGLFMIALGKDVKKRKAINFNNVGGVFFALLVAKSVEGALMTTSLKKPSV